MKVTVPWPKPVLSPNARAHWAQVAAAKKSYRTACKRLIDETQVSMGSLPPNALVGVLMAFYPPNKNRRDRDNLMACMKSALDGIADGLGVDDSRFVPTVKLMDTVRVGGEVEITLEIME